MPRDKKGHFYYGWYPSIVKSDTAHLTLAEDGAYRRLLDEYMTTRKPISADERALARIIGVSVEIWHIVQDEVLPFFKLKDGYLTHDFCDRELTEDNQRIEKARENGKRGGRHKTQYEPDPNPTLKDTPDSQLKSTQNNSDKESDVNLSGFFNQNFDLDMIISDDTRQRARDLSNGWDLYRLISLFNEQVRSGSFKKPTRADAAFLAWIPKFTKGKRP